jgi:oligoendopeptidase F
MVFKNLKETWDLDVFFPGGSESPEFAKYLDALDRDTKALSAEVSGAKISGVEAWVDRLSKIQQLSNRFRQAWAFVSCLDAQNVHDRQLQLIFLVMILTSFCKIRV